MAFVVNTAMDKLFFSTHAGIALAQGIGCWPREPYPLLANPTSTKTEGVVVISNSEFRHKKTQNHLLKETEKVIDPENTRISQNLNNSLRSMLELTARNSTDCASGERTHSCAVDMMGNLGGVREQSIKQPYNNMLCLACETRGWKEQYPGFAPRFTGWCACQGVSAMNLGVVLCDVCQR